MFSLSFILFFLPRLILLPFVAIIPMVVVAGSAVLMALSYQKFILGGEYKE